MRSEPMIAVRDVRASAAWYCRLLGAKNDHGGDEFDRIVDEGRVLLMLHHWGAEEHGAMLDPGDGPVGNGFVLWVYVEDVDTVHGRALEMGADIATEPHANPDAGWREFTVRDPDGYSIGIAET